MRSLVPSFTFTVFGILSLLIGIGAASIAVAAGDTTAPTVSTVTPVTNPSPTATPSYSFTTNEPGAITLGGGCVSPTTTATSGTNSLTFNQLSNGTYECTLTVTDAAGNISNVVPIHFVVAIPAPTAPPVISGISVSNITDNSAVVSWQTDTDSDQKVIYGVNTFYGAQSNPSTVTSSMNHTVTLFGLIPGTMYHFYVQSNNAAGMGTSTDQTLTTTNTGGTTNNNTGGTTNTADAPLALTGIDTSQSSAIAGAGLGSGWKWVLHFTVPNSETTLNLKFSDFTSGSNTISAGGNIRFSSPQSSSAATTDTGIVVGAANTYGTATLNLTQDNNTSAAGRQVDVVVEVAVPSGTPAGNYSANFSALSQTP